MPGDSVFVKGSTHLVCEDYAQYEEGFALVSDGCSSSPRSDVAARLVYLAARRAFVEARLTPEIDGDRLRQLDLRHLALASFDEPLFATFLAARRLGGRVLVTVVGDGEVIVSRQGQIERLKFHYPRHNAPYYPAYALAPSLRDAWSLKFPDNALVVEGWDTGQSQPVPTDPWVFLEWPVDELDWILLTSDGLSSFADESPIDEALVVGQLCAFKNRTGEFLKRRTRRMLDEFREQGISPRDDFSAAILSFE